ncbi:MAG: FmdB family zinc ribbon protein [Bacteroidota bacterium]|jgi:putative FmdB family regulatory protein
MPTYEYKCLDCGHKYEIFQRITEEPADECPVCKGNVKRLIGMGAGPIFKGSGFYQTDYKSRPSESENKIEAKKESTKTE